MNIGIDIGGSHIGIGLIGSNGEIIWKKETDIKYEKKDDSTKVIINVIVKDINDLLSENNINIKDIGMIGIAHPGVLKDNIVIKAKNLGVYNFDYIKELKKYFDIDIKIKNDATCSGIAEKKFGNMKEYSDCIFLSMGTGVGGTAFINNILLEPNLNSGMEFGHTIISVENKNSETPDDNYKSFQYYCSMKNFKKDIIKELKLKEETKGREVLEIIKSLKKNKFENNEYNKIENKIEKYVKYMAIGVSNLINIFEPEVICMGGSFSYFEEILLNKIIKEINEKELLYIKRDKININIAKFKNDAGIIGAANI